MNKLQTDDMEEKMLEEMKQIRGKNGRKIWFAVSIVLVMIILIISFQMLIIPKLEKKIIEEQISVYMEEIKNGYISEMDYNIPAEIYSEITGSWNSTFKSMADYVLGGEEALQQGWQEIMKYMEYSVDSIVKDDEGNYIIEMTFTNRNLGMILSETAEDIKDQKKEWLLNTISGNAKEKFWQCFREKRDSTEDTVSKSIQFHIVKNENGNWSLDTKDIGLDIFAAIAGLEESYLEMQQ